MCKLPAIQDKLAYILELKDAFDALPGQKSVVHSLQPSNLLDQAFFYLYGFSHIKAPPEMLWFAAAFCFIGGGPHLLLSLYYRMLADMVTEPDRAQFLSLAFATIFATSIVALLIAAAIMKHLLFPFMFIVILIGVRFALLWSLPETAPSLVGFASIPNGDQALHAESGVVDWPSLSFEPGEDGGDQISEPTKHTEPHSRVFNLQEHTRHDTPSSTSVLFPSSSLQENSIFKRNLAVPVFICLEHRVVTDRLASRVASNWSYICDRYCSSLFNAASEGTCSTAFFVS
ncbi:hypothetical protein MMC31_002843 [Peltigera leucophlebia]|nr:hypothetical protein [Peltigera leucophlebia]